VLQLKEKTLPKRPGCGGGTARRSDKKGWGTGDGFDKVASANHSRPGGLPGELQNGSVGTSAPRLHIRGLAYTHTCGPAPRIPGGGGPQARPMVGRREHEKGCEIKVGDYGRAHPRTVRAPLARPQGPIDGWDTSRSRTRAVKASWGGLMWPQGGKKKKKKAKAHSTHSLGPPHSREGAAYGFRPHLQRGEKPTANCRWRATVRLVFFLFREFGSNPSKTAKGVAMPHGIYGGGAILARATRSSNEAADRRGGAASF